MRRHFAAACALALGLAAGMIVPASFADAEPQPEPATTASPATTESEIGNYLLAEIGRWRRETWRWEHLMRVRLTRTSRSAERSNDRAHRQRVLAAWKRKARERRRQARRPPRLHAWLCINRYEGPWNDPDPPYYGGLQMDLGFQRTYAPELLRAKGTADRWTALEQMWVAERAYRSGRGFTPWPNTARYCSLLR